MEAIEIGMAEPEAGWVPRACTLPTPEQPLRAAEFDALFAEAVVGVERVAPNRVRLVLRAAPGVAGRAAELVAAETDCCSFFTFVLTVSGGALSLEAEVPDQYAGVLDALAARALAGAR